MLQRFNSLLGFGGGMGGMCLGNTYGLTGSLRVSRKSSILLVCSLIWSRGLGSWLSPLEGPPNEVFWDPRLYPAVPRICAIVAVLLEEHLILWFGDRFKLISGRPADQQVQFAKVIGATGEGRKWLGKERGGRILKLVSGLDSGSVDTWSFGPGAAEACGYSSTV